MSPFRTSRALAASLVALTSTLGAELSAQATGEISGRVRETGGAAIVAAQVSLDGGRQGALTNDFGTFALRDVPAGTHTVSVVRIGYGTFETQVTVTAGGSVGIEVVLEPTAIALGGVTVIGSREEIEETRRQMRDIPGAVVLLDPAHIRQTRLATFGDVLRLTPGVFAQPASARRTSRSSRSAARASATTSTCAA